jgi:hypothetical protein
VNCGKELKPGSKFCVGCGATADAAPLPELPSSPPPPPPPPPGLPKPPPQPEEFGAAFAPSPPGTPSAAPVPKKKNKVLAALICFVVLIAAAGVAWFVWPGSDAIESMPWWPFGEHVASGPEDSGGSGAPNNPDNPSDSPPLPASSAPPAPSAPSTSSAPSAPPASPAPSAPTAPTAPPPLLPDPNPDEVMDILVLYYLSFFEAINNQSIDYLEYVTEDQRENQHPRIFGINSEYLFTLSRAAMDMDTFTFHEVNDQINLNFYVQFDFTRRNRAGGPVIIDSNVQYVEMVYRLNRSTREYEWLVDYSMLVRDVEIGPERIELVI